MLSIGTKTLDDYTNHMSQNRVASFGWNGDDMLYCVVATANNRLLEIMSAPCRCLTNYWTISTFVRNFGSRTYRPLILVEFRDYGGRLEELLREMFVPQFWQWLEDKCLIIPLFTSFRSKQSIEGRRGIRRLCSVDFIPAGKTGKMQPLVIGVNRPFEIFWEEEYHVWRKGLTEKDKTKSGYLRDKRLSIWFPFPG